MKPLKQQLLQIAAIYANGRGLSEARVSTLAFGDGKLIGRLSAGADLTTTRFERAMLWFACNWPDGAEWPEAIARPSFDEGKPAA